MVLEAPIVHMMAMIQVERKRLIATQFVDFFCNHLSQNYFTNPSYF